MATSEEVLPVEVLEQWGLTVKRADSINPGEAQCRWCVKKSDCTAIREQISAMFNAVPNPGLAAPSDLAAAIALADQVEGWIKSIRAEVERRLLAGIAVPNYKLVQGRAGARAWAQESVVEDILKTSMRLKVEEMYDMKLISPTKAEKILKPKQYQRISEFITQSPGRPSVAAASDKRQAITPVAVADLFDVVS